MTASPRATRSFSLPLYLLIVLGLSWPFLIASALWAGGNMLPTYVLNISSMVMVTVDTYIAGRYVFRDGFAGAGWSWGKPKDYLRVLYLKGVWRVSECWLLFVSASFLSTCSASAGMAFGSDSW